MIPAHSPEHLSRVREEEEEGAQSKRNIVQFKLDRIDQKISSKTMLLIFFPLFFAGTSPFRKPQKIQVGGTFYSTIFCTIRSSKRKHLPKSNFKIE